MDQGIATSARDGAPATEASWRAYALFAGDALDAVVEQAVGAAIEHARPDRWAFARWTGERGPHVRLALDGTGSDDEALHELLAAAVQRARGAAAREPLWPTPASWRGGRHVGVETIGLGPGEAPAHPLHMVSSAVVIDALAHLPDGRARAAHALSLMDATGAAVGTRDFWHGVASGWTGTGERGRKLLEGLAAKAEELGPELRRRAGALREDAPLAAGLERYAEACRQLGDPDDVRHHAHMTANRVGVSPLEEALLALVLAAAPRRVSSPAPSRDGEADPVDGRDEEASASVRSRDGEADPVGGRDEEASASVRSRDGEADPVDGRDQEASASVGGLALRPGETVALLGPAGAGKSALLSAVCAAHPSASLAARSASDDRPATEEQRDAELATEATVRENLELHLRIAGSEVGADALLEHAALGDQAGVLVADLDPGDRARLSIACALAGAPELLVLDEPTAGLTAVDREAVWQLLARRGAAGGTTLLATTSLQDAIGVCDRAAVVSDGRVVAVATPGELAEEHFPPRSLHVRVSDEPDRALLEDLPDVSDVRIDERVDHWVVELQTRQPDELKELLHADPEFPEIADVPG